MGICDTMGSNFPVRFRDRPAAYGLLWRYVAPERTETHWLKADSGDGAPAQATLSYHGASTKWHGPGGPRMVPTDAACLN